MNYIRFFSEVSLHDVAVVGGKNASLGEMIRSITALGIRVPDGFALTAQAYWHHLTVNGLQEKITEHLADIQQNPKKREEHARAIRALITSADLPDDIRTELALAYKKLSGKSKGCFVAVRSSATAEDLPGASFAGQQDTYLFIQGIQELEEAVKKCMASLFNERAIVYRHEQGFDDMRVALSVGVQRMVRSDKGAAGVMFSLDTETGFRDAVIIEAAYGLGELVVQGAVTPQEYVVHKTLVSEGHVPIVRKTLGALEKKLVYRSGKGVVAAAVSRHDRQQFVLHDEQILELARAAVKIEDYYSLQAGQWTPMDIEWALDGEDGLLYIVQARPETVHQKQSTLELTRYHRTGSAPVVCEGQSIGQKMVSGRARVIKKLEDLKSFEQGDILVTEMTDPDWVPLVKKAAGMVTDRGGRTCHAAIVSRELGIPAIVGTGNATQVIRDGQMITLDGSQGARGVVLDGVVPFEQEKVSLAHIPQVPAQVMVTMADPDQAFTVAQLPVAGVGLARLEFIISSQIKIHPMAIVEYEQLPAVLQKKITHQAAGYKNPRDFFVQTLAQAIGMIAGALYPRPVIVRLTDFKTNEYANLLGGDRYESTEENPMLGFRGASRYTSERYAPAFALECVALKQVREIMGFENVIIMVPFVRTVQEARETVAVLAEHGLKRGEHGLKLYMMVEIPSNIILFEEFSEYFDGFSIGSNDLTQLTLGVDRDSGLFGSRFDEQDLAVKKSIADVIARARAIGKPIGICGQAPSDHPDFAQFVIDEGITSVSLTSDSIIPFFMRYQHSPDKK